jgi:hypothetical protein
MIIARIFGGLGNQLFQYAAAKALADHHSTSLKVDVSQFETYDLRDFELQKLKVFLSVASPDEIGRLKARHTLQRVKERILPYRYKHFYKEPYFHHDPFFFSLGKSVYLQGYFQSEKYLPSASQIQKPM